MNGRHFWLIFFCLQAGNLFSQQTDVNLPKLISPSPNAASLGIYGQIPVSYFSGLPDITIPIGSATVKNADIPIALNYHGGGIRPEYHPGWTGLGWDLSAGGVITRKVNGVVDEVLDYHYTPENLFSYYDRNSVADNANWASNDTLVYYSNPFDILPAYAAPDEFIFNFGKYSGSFFLDHKGKWQVRSNAPLHLRIVEELKNNYSLAKQPNARANITLKRIFYKFSITTPDGNKYIFGGTPESIEFSRDTKTNPNSNSYNTMVIPTSWFLTKVISATGQEIDLEYERDGVIGIVVSQLLRYNYKEGSYSAQDVACIGNKTMTLVNPSYLKKITTPDQSIEFFRSISNELQYVYDGLIGNLMLYEDLQKHETTSEVTDKIFWNKLDSIRFTSTTDGFLKKIVFSYTEQVTSRLILNSIREVGRAGNINPPYVFSYDQTALPAYNSNKLDHWGFYNGKDYFSLYPKSPITLYTKTDVPTYTTVRNSDFNLMKAGVLTAIKYPTGGSTTFEYEPHEYSMTAKRYPFTVEFLETNSQCGGLRIKRITSTDVLGGQTTKEYLYVKNYNAGGTLSSGVFTGIPQYLDEGSWTFPNGTLTYWFWYDYSIEPLSFTRGNHVTYSEVVEKQADGAYAVYSYSNHDQAKYLDQPFVNGIYTATNQWSLDPNTSMALDRGKLLETREYNPQNILLRKTTKEYDEGVWRNSEAVRMVHIVNREFGGANDMRGTAYLVYTFPQFEIKETDSLWDQNGTNPVVRVRQSTYNQPYREVTEKSLTDSKGATIKSTFKYPFDFPGTSVYKEMTDSNRIVHVVEQTDFNNSTQINFTRTNYYKPFTRIYVPQTIEIKDQSSPIETRVRFETYDNKGNILTMRKEMDHRMSYIWDYFSRLPVAEVVNAAQTDIAYTSFEADGLGNWSLSDVSRNSTLSVTGKRSYKMVSGTNISKSGLTSGKKYIVSYWSRDGAVTVNSTAGVSGPVKNGWTYWEHILPNTTTTVTISGNNKTIDELRLYPEVARMTTYTYESLLGISSQCDPNNRITYYEYDGLGRLMLIKDQDRNITKTVNYHYRGN